MEAKSRSEILSHIFQRESGSYKTNTTTQRDSSSSGSYETDSDEECSPVSPVKPPRPPTAPEECSSKEPTPKDVCDPCDPKPRPKKKTKKGGVVKHDKSGVLGIIVFLILFVVVLFFLFSIPAVVQWFDDKCGSGRNSLIGRGIAVFIALVVVVILICWLFAGAKSLKSGKCK